MTKPSWPDTRMPEPMALKELETILMQLGTAHGRPGDRFPLSRLAPALGMTSSRGIHMWLNGKASPDPARAKLLRIFAVQGRVF